MSQVDDDNLPPWERWPQLSAAAYWQRLPGGWIEHGAHVADTATVQDGAVIAGQARLWGYASARGPCTLVSDYATIRDHAVLHDARIVDHALVTDYAQVLEACVMERARVSGNAYVLGQAIVRGRTQLVSGHVIIGGEWHTAPGIEWVGQWRISACSPYQIGVHHCRSPWSLTTFDIWRPEAWSDRAAALTGDGTRIAHSKRLAVQGAVSRAADRLRRANQARLRTRQAAATLLVRQPVPQPQPPQRRIHLSDGPPDREASV